VNLKRINFEKNLSNKVASEIIIFLLAEVWPLTAKEVHYRICKHKKISYQSTFNVLKELTQEEVVAKKNNTYKLETKWLDGIMNFAKTTKQAYLEKEKEDRTLGLEEQWK